MTLTLRIDNFSTLEYGGTASVTLDQKGCSVGRAPAMDWVLPDPAKHVSSHHFDISYSGGVYYLTDVSTNGTFRHGKPSRLEGAQMISAGDKFRVGHYSISAALPEQERTVVAKTPSPSMLQSPPGKAAETPNKAVVARPVDAIVKTNKSVVSAPGNISTPPPMSKPLFQSPLMQSPVLLQTPQAKAPQVPVSQAKAPRMQSSPQMPAAMPRPSPDLSSMPPSRIQTPVPSPVSAPNDALAKAPDASSISTPNPLLARAPAPTPTSAPNGGSLVSVPPFAKPSVAQPSVAQAPIAKPPAVDKISDNKASEDIDPVLAAFCKGAGMSADKYAGVDPIELANVLGQCVRIATDGIMDVLQEQANIKHSTGGDNSTVRSTAGNNPMKFLSETDHAIEAMFLKPQSGFMAGNDGFKDAMGDIRQHQAAMSAAFQPAIANLLSGLSPEEIESNTSDQSEAWNAYVALWAEKSGNNRNGMLDLFLKAFATAFGSATR